MTGKDSRHLPRKRMAGKIETNYLVLLWGAIVKDASLNVCVFPYVFVYFCDFERIDGLHAAGAS